MDLQVGRCWSYFGIEHGGTPLGVLKVSKSYNEMLRSGLQSAVGRSCSLNARAPASAEALCYYFYCSGLMVINKRWGCDLVAMS